MNTLAIDLKNVQKKYLDYQVLNDVSLSVNKGEYMGLIGVNGGGKTTLIKCILDFCELTSGKILLFDKPHTQAESRQRLIFLPEKFLPPYYLTGMDFLIYMSELHGVVFNEKEIRKLLKIVDLDATALKKPVRLYSKGMGQKLGLVACLYCDKDLIIFDEPMSGLDPKARAYLKQYLLELKQTGKTIFFSTHLLADTEVLCDRIAILHQGRIRFVGTVEDCTETFKSNSLEQAYLSCVGA